MYAAGREQMKHISAYAGARRDYVQGGGGNTSVKFDERWMAIKASGYTLAEITEDKGYVTVDYPRIKRYYEAVDADIPRDYEKESLSVNLDSVALLPGMEYKRPSVEVGFHSFLQKCVIHTHSVYANILCCADEGRAVAEEIFADSGIHYLFIPYIDPGFRLTLAIRDAVDAYQSQHGVMPGAIFLENHGVIAGSDDMDDAIHIHETVNTLIKESFGLGEYPQPDIISSGDGYTSDTEYLRAFVRSHDARKDYFSALKLYPDQLVYITPRLDGVIEIDASSGAVSYRTSEKEARTIEETLVSVAYVIGEIGKAGLTLRQMGERDADFIRNWESEKYRSKLVK
jgi:rhamnose utilization protein RhaD (predicted bifunctional aldolase and dehydrogenase)